MKKNKKIAINLTSCVASERETESEKEAKKINQLVTNDETNELQTINHCKEKIRIQSSDNKQFCNTGLTKYTRKTEPNQAPLFGKPRNKLRTHRTNKRNRFFSSAVIV